jgi:hypothetical protein
VTLLHTKGYSDILEVVKSRAKKLAVAMARMDFTVTWGTILKQLYSMTLAQVMRAADDVDSVALASLTDEEEEAILLTFAADFLAGYRHELEQVRIEKQAKIETAAACGEMCGTCRRRMCLGFHAGQPYLHICAECF